MYIATPYDLHSSRWTHRHPSAPVAAHLVSLARAALTVLCQLLLMGPDAPPAQQELAVLLQQQARKQQQQQLPDAGSKGSKKRAAAEQQQQQRGTALDLGALRQLEMAALARAWRLLCMPDLAAFDAWVVLRREALPCAERCDPLALQQLHTLLEQQRRRHKRLAAAAAAAGAKQQQQQQLAGLLGGAGALTCDAPKNARAMLRDIPPQVLLSKPADKLRDELLVGFDPVAHYLSLASERYGHLAAFCADGSGGFPAIGIKWLPAAFLPAPLRPALAHGRLEVGISAAGAGGVKQGGSGARLLVPNMPQVLSELAELGVGLVEQLVLL
jgi:U3 small nucleolar RNA-associated protein 22